ncbi:MAG TPA: GvpL/GvpF family gas vesicle protein [Candidatus Wunengus sp. YC60]|uniref:GvpL/GvpF family gas vesicle protein n=1 Tax=Candidatus Wunengus sp. YC60 TaxID=3367697 RepID=UPI0040258AD4
MYRYLYCITKVLHKQLNDMIGLENTTVRTLQYKEIMAVVSEVLLAKIPVSNESVLCHEAVVEAVQREQTVLPMRFSSVFNDDTAALQFLKNHYAVFVSDLERLQGKLEMGIRVILGRENQQLHNTIKHDQENAIKFETCKSNPGTTYLQQRRAYYASQDEGDDRAREIVKTCHAQFEDICVEYKRDTHTSFSQGVSLNYLIHKDSLGEFKNRFNDLKPSLNELQFMCSGPWPPYHFVSSENSA